MTVSKNIRFDSRKRFIPFEIKEIKVREEGRGKRVESITIEDVRGDREINDWNEVKGIILQTPGISLSNLKFLDLLTTRGKSRGIYIFCESTRKINNARIAYVGKNSSRTLIERIASHLAMRSEDYMNVFVKKLFIHLFYNVNVAEQKNKPLFVFHEGLDLAVDEILGSIQKYSLIFIPVDGERMCLVQGNSYNSYLSSLEKRMIDSLQPYLDPYKVINKRNYDKRGKRSGARKIVHVSNTFFEDEHII